MARRIFFVAVLFLVGALLMLSGCFVGRVYTPHSHDNYRPQPPGYGNYRPQPSHFNRNYNYHPQPPKKPAKHPNGDNYHPQPHQPRPVQDGHGAESI